MIKAKELAKAERKARRVEARIQPVYDKMKAAGVTAGMIVHGEPMPPKVKAAYRKIKREAIPSTHCPTCGKRLKPMTPAEKQRAYRERKRAAR